MAEESGIFLRITSAAADVDLAEVEELALQLRLELVASGLPGVERMTEGPAPEGTRSVELLVAGVGFLLTGLSAAADAAQIADFVRRWLSGHPRRQRISVSVVAGGGAGGPARAGRRSALLVANAAYRDPGLRRLRSPVPDIRALADVLGAPSIGAFEVDTLTDADEAVLRRRVAAFFAERGPDDVLLLHFSCHGLKDQRGRLYLAAADTELSALAATGLPASFVSEQMSESASRSVLLILDCCYSGAFAHDTAVRADRSVHIADAFRGGGTGRIVLTASSATEYSFEGGHLTSYEAQPSVFTEALVSGLRTGVADLDHDGEISVDELFAYASRRVREAGVGQVPRKWAYETTGALVVARSVRPAVLPEEIRSDLASDRRVLRLEAVKALAALLAGSREGFRQAARATLADLRDHDDSVQVRAAAAAALGDADPPVLAPAPLPPPAPEPVTDTPAPRTTADPEPVTDTPAPRTTAAPETTSPSPETPPAPTATDRPQPTATEQPRPTATEQPRPTATGQPATREVKQSPGGRRKWSMIAAAAGVAGVVAAIAIPKLTSHDSSASHSGPMPFGTELSAITLAHTADIESAQLSPGGRWVATLDKPADPASAQTAVIWNTSTGASTSPFQTDTEVTFSPDGTMVAGDRFTGTRQVVTVSKTPMGLFGGGSTIVELRATGSGKLLASLPDHQGGAYVAFSPDGKTVATASTRVTGGPFDAPVRIWDPATGTLLTTLANRSDGIQAMAFSGDGKVLVTGAAGGVVKIWDVAAGKATATLSNAWFPVWISPDGSTVAARRPGSGTGFQLCDVPGGKVRASIGNAGSFAGFGPDSRTYATDTAGTVRLYDLATRKERGRLTARIRGDLVFSPDGKLVAAIDGDGVPALFDAASGQGLMELAGPSGGYTDLVFSPDGLQVIATGTDKTVRRWYVKR